jgi:predicted nucleic acid-binding protein
MIIISDNSALSCLAELGELDLLPKLYGSVTITTTVLSEAQHTGAPSALRLFVASPPTWLGVVADVYPYLAKTASLESGEASSITLAWQDKQNSYLLMDERRGRKICASLGLKFTGVAGLLTDAAIAGHVDFNHAFAKLRATKFRLAESIIEELRQRYLNTLP